MDQWSVAEMSSRSAAEASGDTAAPLLRDRAASDRPSKFVPSSQATELAAGKSDCAAAGTTATRRHFPSVPASDAWRAPQDNAVQFQKGVTEKAHTELG